MHLSWKKTIHPASVTALEQLQLILKVGHYSRSALLGYSREVQLLFQYYPDTSPEDITTDQINLYLLYCKEVLGAGHSKSHLIAQSLAFLFKRVLSRPQILPSIIYPRKKTLLPAVMLPAEIKKTLEVTTNPKHRAIFSLLYSSGVRLAELCNIRLADIDSAAMRIKVVQGKGNKDRFTLLSQQILELLRIYYLMYKPTHFLFNGWKSGKAICPRTVQHAFSLALQKARLAEKNYSVHTLRHSFATHLLDDGTDLHTIKELLGHSDIRTTMTYLHLSTKRVQQIVNPFDQLNANAL